MTRLVCGELRKFSRQRWVWLGAGLAVTLELVLVGLLSRAEIQELIRRMLSKLALSFDANYSALTVATFLLNHTSAEVGSLFIILAGSSILGQELENGSLRMTLCRPISRTRLLFVKWIALAVFVAGVNLFIAITCLAVGFITLPAGNLLFWSFKEGVFGLTTPGLGLTRYALAVVFLALSQLTLAVLPLSLSCFRLKPAVAAIVTLTILLLDDVIRLQAVPRSWFPWFLMSHLTGWMRAFETPIPWRHLAANYSALAMLDASLLAVAWSRWRRLDITRGSASMGR